MDGRLMLLVGIGGAIGAILRYIISDIMPSEGLPYGTVTVNLIGSLLLGIMFGAIAADALISQDNLLLFGTGILGAFTTMSAFAMDTVNLSENEFSTAMIYVTLTIMGSIGLAWSGYRIGIGLFS
ncbi:MAG TPA: fluoride efflux transporter CrcB [Candidatus Thalassarchaeaceae archaeon]|jgi:CrcB protein|nr:fluoride efflux transporter CrcB [Euryarchaeota archaeon]MDG1548163.1 fluoride efflux transporter CrcB [Candidatus Thalassarchaeaceae archaeon]DAC61946.1 MAG TPA: fluoride efflux transporter CrcB [Candidatus Poseidoniales archaeon]MBT3847425.1 fluoride efflux transporter CrcB [Euryarchaeota archaeon]MBT4157183.1 fluoride efflux transporter CrcB [Euryarchaeota archaeon]